MSPETPLVIERWGLVRCLCDVCVGCLAYQLRGRLGAALPAGTAPELLLVALATAFIATVRPGPAGFLAPLLCGAFVVVFSGERGALSRLLRGRPFQALGRWSFSIYMLHVLVFEVIRSAAHVAEGRSGRTLLVTHGDGQLVTTGAPALDLVLTLATLGLVVVPLAALSYRLIERPALAAAKRLAGADRGRSAPTPRLTPSRSLP